jgi:hypothetical protein
VECGIKSIAYDDEEHRLSDELRNLYDRALPLLALRYMGGEDTESIVESLTRSSPKSLREESCTGITPELFHSSSLYPTFYSAQRPSNPPTESPPELIMISYPHQWSHFLSDPVTPVDGPENSFAMPPDSRNSSHAQPVTTFNLPAPKENLASVESPSQSSGPLAMNYNNGIDQTLGYPPLLANPDLDCNDPDLPIAGQFAGESRKLSDAYLGFHRNGF